MDRVYLCLYHAFRLFARLPLWVLRPIAYTIAFIVYHLDSRHRRVVFTNFNICFDDMDERSQKSTARALYRNYAMYLFWYFRLLSMSKEQILNIVEFRQPHVLQSALDSGEKVLFVTAHFGMWELLPSAAAMKYNIRIAIVGRDLDSVVMNDILEKNREKNGIKLISKFGGAKNIIKSIKDGYALGILTDQDCDLREGNVYEINGYKLTQSKIASKLAIKHDMTMIFTYIHKCGDKFVIDFYDSVRPSDMLKQISAESTAENITENTTENTAENTTESTAAQSLEQRVEWELTRMQLDATRVFWTRHKDEYFWFHKRFKTFHEDKYK